MSQNVFFVTAPKFHPKSVFVFVFFQLFCLFESDVHYVPVIVFSVLSGPLHFFLLLCVVALRPSQQFFSHVVMHVYIFWKSVVHKIFSMIRVRIVLAHHCR